jgi:hypothetical protein
MAALRGPGSGMAPGHRQRAPLAGAVMADRIGAAVNDLEGEDGSCWCPAHEPHTRFALHGRAKRP